MITKFPRWVWPVAWGLAFVAGMVNVVGLLGFDHQAVTHLTGTTSLLGTALAAGHLTGATHYAAVIASFVAGAMLGGVLIGDDALHLGRRHGAAFAVETLLLCAAVPMLARQSLSGSYLAAAACGLQNAMSSAYSGGIVRTTHVSGMFTDLGIFLGHALRGVKVDRRRIRLCTVVITGFLAGGVAAGVLFRWLDYGTLYLPTIATALAALICLLKPPRPILPPP